MLVTGLPMNTVLIMQYINRNGVVAPADIITAVQEGKYTVV